MTGNEANPGTRREQVPWLRELALPPASPIPERTATSRTAPAVIGSMRGRMPLYSGAVNEGGIAEVKLSSFTGREFFLWLDKGLNV